MTSYNPWDSLVSANPWDSLELVEDEVAQRRRMLNAIIGREDDPTEKHLTENNEEIN